jgi:phosphohistidine phosphatase
VLKARRVRRARNLRIAWDRTSTTFQETPMNLILWRHAEAEDTAANDLARRLTTKGRKEAQQSAKWLRARLPNDAVILASPAARTIQTAEALTDQYRVVRELAPGASADDVLTAAGWPHGVAPTVVVVGHQPTLGEVACRLLNGDATRSLPMKKGAVWWFASREARHGSDIAGPLASLLAAISPDLA